MFFSWPHSTRVSWSGTQTTKDLKLCRFRLAIEWGGFYILKLIHLGIRIIFYISDIKKLATSEAICSKCQGHIYCSEAPALNMMWPHWQGPFEDIDDIDIDIEDIGKDHLKIFHVIVQLNRTSTNQFSPQKPRMPRERRKKILPSWDNCTFSMP